MKKHKKIFGLFGLILVAVMTAFAASLPNPNTHAISSSVTDSIIVTVTAANADVNIVNPKSGDILSNPLQTIDFNYTEVDRLTITLEYTDKDDLVKNFTLLDEIKNYQSGTGFLNLDLLGSDYGYGEYVIRTTGSSRSGVPEEDIVSFLFVPVKGTVKEEPNGDIFATLEYDDSSTDLDHFEINVYDENGNIVPGLSPIVVKRADGKKIEIPFYDYDLPEGDYTVSITAFDINDVAFYKSYDVLFHYKPLKTPDTGLFSGLNISKTDYLVTGLLVFFIVGIVGLAIIFRSRRTR